MCFFFWCVLRVLEREREMRMNNTVRERERNKKMTDSALEGVGVKLLKCAGSVMFDT